MNKFSRLSSAKTLPFPWKKVTDLSETCTKREIQDTKVNGDLLKAKVFRNLKWELSIHAI